MTFPNINSFDKDEFPRFTQTKNVNINDLLGVMHFTANGFQGTAYEPYDRDIIDVTFKEVPINDDSHD